MLWEELKEDSADDWMPDGGLGKNKHNKQKQYKKFIMAY